jgi:hypothetical protein
MSLAVLHKYKENHMPFGFLDDEEDYTGQAAPYISGNGFGGGLLADSKPKKRGFSPDLGLLGLAAGLLEPTRGGKFSSSLANGLSGWASGIASQRKLDEADVETDPDALMRQYMAQARAKAQVASEFPQAETWSMAPFVAADGGAYQMGNKGSIRKLPMVGRYATPTMVDTGGNIQFLNPSQPNQPLAIIPKELNPLQRKETDPNRFTQQPNQDGSFTQTDTMTGKQETVSNPNAPKPPSNEYLDTMAKARDFDTKIDDYIKALETRSRIGGVIPGEQLANLRNKHGALTMNMKDIYGLGVLNGGDMAQIQKQLMDPTSPNAVMYSNDILIKQAQDTKEAMRKLAAAKKDEFRKAGFRVDDGSGSKPIKANFNADGQDYELQFESPEQAQKDLDSRTDLSPNVKSKIQAEIDKAKGPAPYSVNTSSVPTLKKPNDTTLAAARAHLKQFEGDPAAYNSVKEQIEKQLKDSGYDPSGL